MRFNNRYKLYGIIDKNKNSSIEDLVKLTKWGKKTILRGINKIEEEGMIIVSKNESGLITVRGRIFRELINWVDNKEDKK